MMLFREWLLGVSSSPAFYHLVVFKVDLGSVQVKGRLEHAISKEEIPGWVTAKDVDAAVEVDMGDYVVYDDWIGQVALTIS